MRPGLVRAFLLIALAALPAAAQPAGMGPVRIILLDGCTHAMVQQEVAKTRTSVPLVVDSSAMDLETCQVDPAKAPAALTALAKRLAAERKAAIRRREPPPLPIVYFGTILEGNNASAWVKAVKQLSQSALLVAPGGNDPRYDAGEIWPSSQYSFKVGNAPGGSLTGSVGKAISVYLDYGAQVEVVIGNVQFFASGTSTASMLLSSHLANVLASGAARNQTPVQILKKLKRPLRGQVIPEEDLEARLAAALR